MKKINIDDAALFGDPDARNPVEQEGLKRYFLEPPGYSNVLTGTKTIIVGRKGTGKTAIRTKLLELTEDKILIDIDPLAPNHKLFAEYARILEQSEEPSFSAYESAWRAYIVASILRDLVHRRLLGLGERKTALQYVANLVGPTAQAKFWDRLRELSVGLGTLVNASVKLDTSMIHQGLPTEAEIPTFLDMISNACKRHHVRIFALVDRIDQQLEQPLQGQSFFRYAKYLGGICLADARIASRVARQQLSVYVFARQDLLEEFMPHLHHATEFEGLIYKIPWRIDQLMDVIAARITNANGSPYYATWDFETKRRAFLSSSILYAVFDRFKADGMELWYYFLVHTHMRPRDIINICNSCREEAASSRKSQIDSNSLNRGMHVYSTRRYQDLVATHRWMVSGFQSLIDSFRGGPLVYSRQEILSHINGVAEEYGVCDVTAQPTSTSDSKHLLRLLYKSGFLVTPEADERHLPYLAHYLEPYLDIDARSNWLVHPAFVREMCEGKPPPNMGAYLRRS